MLVSSASLNLSTNHSFKIITVSVAASRGSTKQHARLAVSICLRPTLVLTVAIASAATVVA